MSGRLQYMGPPTLTLTLTLTLPLILTLGYGGPTYCSLPLVVGFGLLVNPRRLKRVNLEFDHYYQRRRCDLDRSALIAFSLPEVGGLIIVAGVAATWPRGLTCNLLSYRYRPCYGLWARVHIKTKTPERVAF